MARYLGIHNKVIVRNGLNCHLVSVSVRDTWPVSKMQLGVHVVKLGPITKRMVSRMLVNQVKSGLLLCTLSAIRRMRTEPSTFLVDPILTRLVHSPIFVLTAIGIHINLQTAKILFQFYLNCFKSYFFNFTKVNV